MYCDIPKSFRADLDQHDGDHHDFTSKDSDSSSDRVKYKEDITQNESSSSEKSDSLSAEES